MKCKFMITLEYPELLALGGTDVQQWLEQRLDGKVSDVGGFRITSQSRGPDRMIMHCIFEVSHYRALNEKTMRDWLADSPPYFFVRTVKKPAREGW
ncbi:hypothetical protein [Anaeroselena agilis]|uniref:Uncharacterized protein n=1 Tax=Anaeroselena agilis TaxID=3063788 RepID=A0ABU3P4M0_9FIRM|nr:hypothetical protein [Selenomonadales bacterium 4137-cl]